MAQSSEPGMVELVNPSNGKTYRFSQRYESAYRDSGWTDPTPAPAGLGSPEQQANTARVASQSSVLAGPHYMRDMASQAIPSAIAGVTTALMPEAAIPARLLAALIAGTLGDLGAQKVRQEPLSLPNALVRGGIETVAQGTGEGIDAIRGGVAGAPRALAADAYAMPGKAGIKTARAGDFLTREGFRMGERGTTTGTDAVEAARAASTAAEQAAAASAKATRFKSDIAHAASDRVLARLGQSASAADKAELKTLADAMRRENFTQGPNGLRVEKPLTAEEVLGLKRGYDEKSLPTYKALDAAGGGRPATSIEQKFYKAVADESREWLRDNVKGLGRQMQRTSELIRSKPAMEYAETRTSPKATLNPLKMLENALNDRRGKASLALSMRGPAAVAERIPSVATRQAPRALGLTIDELLQYLNRSSAPSDSTIARP